ncbi:MAG: hypothetical protein Q8R24_03375 [Legionellaceae bacterium]|nr:hypothetical protein [Legionellaceae bacterium]
MITQSSEQALSYQGLLDRTEKFTQQFQDNALLRILQSTYMDQASARQRFLDCAQTFSNWFQKTVLLRAVFAEERAFVQLAEEHLNEEYGHHTILEKERGYRPRLWDPTLEGISCWFAWKMLSLDDFEKILHVQVLEIGSDIVCPIAEKLFEKYDKTSYFSMHRELDNAHKCFGIEHLALLTSEKYQRLYQVQEETWSMFNAAMKRMSELITM